MTVKTRSPRSPRSLRHQLLIGASIGSMLLAGVAQAQDTRGRGGASVNPADAAIRAAQQQAARAAQTNSASQRAVAAFRRAAEGRAAMQAAQVAARAAAQAAQSNVPNGLGQGGLQVAEGVVFGPDGKPIEGSLWIGANGPTQSQGTDGRTNVAIDQTQKQAILNWDSFNVGRETDLTFKQGGADWVALNRVTDVNADPTRILGSIKADGTVLILNRNGIIFGGASQVNVRNLVASSAALSDDQFLTRGIYSQNAGNYVPSFTAAGGAVTVEAGAQITTHTPTSVTAGGGYVLLMGTEVTNAGSITTPRGQTLLSAGDDFIIRKGFGTEENQYSTTRGNEVRGLINTDSTSGTVINAGLIEAAQGDITLAGRTIRQDGVITATTSVNQRGTIHLLNSASDAEGSVTLGKDSLTLILPELDSDDTALNSQRDALIKDSAVANANRASTIAGGFDDRSTLNDRLDQSRVEIVTGGDVLFEGGSQTMANGGQVSVQANTGRITVADSANIDVSGTMGVALDMGSNSILVNVQGNELRDSPVNRDEAGLKNQNVWIDVRDLILLPAGTGGYESDRWYTKGGLLEVGGYIGNTPHSIGEWTAIGGTITLAANEVVAQQGAVFDISGGSLDYASGYVRSTMMLGADGRMYDVRNAPSYLPFLAVGNAFARKHDRWGPQYTEVFANRLFSRGTTMRWEDGYTVGRDAGRLILSTPTAIFDGDILADTINGYRQTDARPVGLTDGYKAGQDTAAKAGSLLFGPYVTTPPPLATSTPVASVDVRIGDIDPVTAGLTPDWELPADRANSFWLDAGRVNDWGLGELTIATSQSFSLESDLVLADAGELSVAAPVVNILAGFTARGGKLNIGDAFVTNGIARPLGQPENTGVTIGEGVAIDLRGAWVNLMSDPGAVSDLAWIDGGSVSIKTSGDLRLAAGSLIDVSSGGAVLEDRTTHGGRGGDVTLHAGEQWNGGTATGILVLDGAVRGFGAAGSGALSLQTSDSWQIGGHLLETDGTLAAGETALIDLVLTESVSFAAGDIATSDLRLTKKTFGPGETSSRDISWSLPTDVSFRVAAAWTLPASLNVRSAEGVDYYGGGTVPAGTQITLINGGSQLASGYRVDPQVLPDGLPITAFDYFVARGSPHPTPITLNPGDRLAARTVLDRAVSVRTPRSLETDNLLDSGFSSYAINAREGLAVMDGATLAPVVRALRFTPEALDAASGIGADQALELWVPPLFLENATTREMTQRVGADLTLRSGATWSPGLITGGTIHVGKDANLAVDPGRKVELASGGQITVEGRIDAPGGLISILNQRFQDDRGPNGLSIWIGSNAVLNAAGQAFVARDVAGNRYGTVLDGGDIVLGSVGGAVDTETGERPSSDAFVVVRSGAVLDVSGAAATFDIRSESGLTASARPLSVATDGGEIAMRSYNGIFNEGTMRAAAGGAGASGGSLLLELESPIYIYGNELATFPDALRAGRVLTVYQDALGGTLSPMAQSGQTGDGLVVGQASVSVAQIDAGGFDSVTLSARDAIAFDGEISMALGRSLTLSQGKLVNTVEGGNVDLSAPYIRLDGRMILKPGQFQLAPDMLPTFAQGGDLRLEGHLAEVRNQVAADYGHLTLSSATDLRFLRSTEPDLSDQFTTVLSVSVLANSGDVTLRAGQLYPVSDAYAGVYAGATLDSTRIGAISFVEHATLSIEPFEGATVSAPYSAFGDIVLSANTILQGGRVLAPFGSIRLVANPTLANEFEEAITRVELLPGSVTSVSAKGMLIPYGGTSDGVTYTVDGRAAATLNLFTGQESQLLVGNNPTGVAGIAIAASDIVSHEGSLLDVSGGGSLAGAAFVPGRGGSVDALLYPREAGGQVFAILPGVVTAPVAGGYYDEWTGAAPELGQQIVVPEGVPGLSSGTYTLLPANYALLPGAFRVELGAGLVETLPGVTAGRDGSYVFGATARIAGTDLHSALPRIATVASGKVARTWSQYDETSYAAFQIARAATLNQTRPMLERDGRFLVLGLRPLPRSIISSNEPALSFEGKADFRAGENGYDGALALLDIGGAQLRVIGPDRVPTRTSQSITAPLLPPITEIAAATINAIGAPTIYIGGTPSLNVSGSNLIEFRNAGGLSGGGAFGGLTFAEGAVLEAGQFLIVSNPNAGPILFERGAGLSTLGRPASAPDSRLGYQYTLTGLAVSSGWIDLAPPANTSTNRITLADGAFLRAEGSIGFAANGGVAIEGTPRINARYLGLSSSAFNIGTAEALAAASASGTLPTGLALDQAFLNSLLLGDPVSGAPAVETLTLTAANSLNVFGSLSLSTYDASGASLLDELVINAPAVYGYGAAGDVFTLATDTLVWNGLGTATTNASSVTSYASARPGATAGALGQGRWAVDARQIVLGYPAIAQSRAEIQFNRLVLGFADVDLQASERIISNNSGNLSVFANGPSPTATYDAATYAGTAGNLNLVTPLLTGDAGSTITYRAGGKISVRRPDGFTGDAPAANELGAIVKMVGDSIDIDTTIALPSGQLMLTATQDIMLEDNARLDLSGRRVDFFDVSRYFWGGEVAFESTRGNILLADGSVIDVSAENSDAGFIRLRATDSAAGLVSLDGDLLGTGGEGFKGGTFDVRAQRIGEATALSADFAALNTALNESGFTESRSFTFKQGSLTIGNELQAHEVTVSIDGGSLTVNGRVDASGARPGIIRLSARDDLILAGAAVLDASASTLFTDSYGQAIEAKNRGHIELTSRDGTMRLQSGAALDLSSADGIARGRIELNVSRVTETGGDARIDAGQPIVIDGAASIALNAFWRYSPTDAAGTIVQDNGAGASGTPVNASGVLGLDQIDGRSVLFMAAADDGGLTQRTSGLRSYGAAYHFRPGVEINSEGTPSGNLTVGGDLDLARYRYGPDADRQPASATYGAGEPLSFLIRAAGDLKIKGSITDGFGVPAPSPDDNGWVLIGILEQDYQLSSPAILPGGASGTVTTLPGGSSTVLGFPIAVRLNTQLRRGNAVPFEFLSNANLLVPPWAAGAGGWTATAPIYNAAGVRIYGPGDKVNVALPSGTRFAAGTVLPSTSATTTLGTLTIRATAVPAGTSLAVFNGAVSLNANVSLPAGSVIPAGVNLRTELPTRPVGPDGRQGEVYAVAPMLAAGSMSASIRIASGAELSSADTRALQAASLLAGRGDLVLNDPHLHFQNGFADPQTSLFSVIRTGTGSLDLLAGDDISMGSAFGIYTAGMQQVPDAGISLQAGTYIADHGGDMRVAAQGDVTGSLWQASASNRWFSNNYGVGNWLVRAGDQATGAPAVWSINFGQYFPMGVLGFSGIGSLGGGNVSLLVGGDAGVFNASSSGTDRQSTALVVAIGASGYATSVDKTVDGVVTGGTLKQAGGGDLYVRIAGSLNPGATFNTSNFGDDFNGSFTNIRGDAIVHAATIGRVPLAYGSAGLNDPRNPDPYVAAQLGSENGRGGPVLVPGDGQMTLTALGDLVLGGAGDPGFVRSAASAPGSQPGFNASAFSLWRPNTGITLTSAGGNLTPVRLTNAQTENDRWTDGFDLRPYVMLPGRFEAVAASGSIFYGHGGDDFNLFQLGINHVDLAPSPSGNLTMLAQGSIFGAAGDQFAGGGQLSNTREAIYLTVSGADSGPNDIPNPFKPTTANAGFWSFDRNTIGSTPRTTEQPIRLYAVEGDIVNVLLGEAFALNVNGPDGSIIPTTSYLAAAQPVSVRAGRDIVNFGTGTVSGGFNPSLFINRDATDVSMIDAGRNIYNLSVRIGGPGTLEVSAGGEIYQGNVGSITSLGPLVEGDGRTGASVAVMAGMANAVEWNALRTAYFDPANLADPERPLADPENEGKVVKVYDEELGDWLQGRYDFTGSDEEALTYFDALAPEQQRIFLRQVYYAELKEGGREYNNPDSSRFGSYLRGRQMIGTLFPEEDANGAAIKRTGSYTAFGGSGIQTLFGGDIDVLVPGGQIIIGVQGEVPPASSGIITQGQGDISLYSSGSILLGLSRIMTTFGGSIFGWSATGDINAGRGSKTTLVYTPPRRVYDVYGNIRLAPQVPSSGAGIATLNPIPEVEPGDIDLIAPLGTIDAGEAGIRVSGNVNLAALQVLNAANIQVQGDAAGIPLPPVVNTGALTAASSATTAVVNEAAQLAERARPQVRTDIPMLVTVTFAGFGEP